VTPGGWPARLGPNSGEARRSLAGEGREEGLGVTGVWVLADVRGGGGAGEGTRRRRPVPAAAARCPVKDGRGRNDTRLHELW
jgi:hypothetical protein